MSRIILPVIFVALAVASFFMLTKPIYGKISELKNQNLSYNSALGNSKALEGERDKLTQKYNSISQENLDRLAKLLPENVDNIRLILEIEKIASPYSMVLKDVKYDAEKSAATGATKENAPKKEYGVWNLQFSTFGTYPNFVNFVKDLEKNLRLVDITGIQFSSGEGTSALPDIYKYTFNIRTYWLKN